MLKQLPAGPKIVAYEAGNQMKWVSLFLKKQDDVTPYPVHPNEVKWIVSSRGKTDKVDARKLAELARADMLPRKIHIVEGTARELRELVSARQQLQSKRIALINTLRGYVKQEGIKFPPKFFSSKDWKQKLTNSRVSEPLRYVIDSFMGAIDGLMQSEKLITERILKIEDKRCDLLETIPLIGKITSRVLVGGLDNVDRFDGKREIANYGALTPTIYQSGNVTNLGRINRDGRHEIRKVLLQCAHSIARTNNTDVKPLKTFFTRLEKKRGKKKAVVALARKLLTTAYGVLKSGKPYDPAKLYAYAA
jgi:transposase